MELTPSDSLILLTDGFFEWPNSSGELYGLERLESAIRKHANLLAQEMIAGLYEDVREFASGAAQLDDLTAVIIRRSDTSKASDGTISNSSRTESTAPKSTFSGPQGLL